MVSMVIEPALAQGESHGRTHHNDNNHKTRQEGCDI